MPSALYTISYKPTCGVVALCSFEKKLLPDQAARDQLLSTLIGTRLPILMSGNTATLEIAASELGCDLVPDPLPQELEDILANPYRFRVSIDPDGTAPTVPGDDHEKLLIATRRTAVQTIELFSGAPTDEPAAQVVVTLGSEPDAGITARLLFEGRVPLLRQTRVTEDGRTVSRQLVFELVDTTVVTGQEYGAMFLMQDAPIVARMLKAVDRPSIESTAIASKAELRKRPSKPETKAPKQLRRTVRKTRSTAKADR
jgi:hypothetical protein